MFRTAALVAMALASACGSDSVTAQDLCDDIGDAVCAQAALCDRTDDVSDCLAAWDAVCCPSGNCDWETELSDDDVDDCKAAIEDTACELFGAPLPQPCATPTGEPVPDRL